jgi:hypothetical protein
LRGTFLQTKVNAILDEQNVLTQAIQFSPFNKPFIEEIEEWAAKLLYVSECIDWWYDSLGLSRFVSVSAR